MWRAYAAQLSQVHPPTFTSFPTIDFIASPVMASFDYADIFCSLNKASLANISDYTITAQQIKEVFLTCREMQQPSSHVFLRENRKN